MRRPTRSTVWAGALAVLAGGAVFVIASTVFAHHSLNHDEGVYLFQAALLLDGSFVWEPGALQDVFRPWFFVEDGSRLYPKYPPLPAGLYAIGMYLLDEPRVVLAAVAAANTFLVYLLGRRTFDARVGLVASAAYAVSPLALVTSSVFLPYAPTTLFTLSFAVAYLHAVDTRSRLSAIVAGAAIGLAFFARPFTAVLFALPFIAHAVYQLIDGNEGRGVQLLTGGVGTVSVGLTLGYNRLVTGEALTFPYAAFAPRDGPGFGTRRMLGHVVEYTPTLAMRANASVLWQFGTRWFAAGVVGTLLALAGVSMAIGQWSNGRSVRSGADEDSSAGILVAALLVSIPAGNLLFWGNVNILGATPRDGMIGHLGPFYHFDMLVPLAIFAAVTLVVGWDRVARYRRAVADRRLAPTVVLILLVVTGLLGGGLVVGTVAGPLERNADHGDDLASVYAPLDANDLDDGLVFIPRPYGDWQQHPFQYLRNDPDFDGTVYALDRHTASNFAVLDAFPERTPYRFTYHGDWPPGEDPIVPTLEPLDRKRGENLTGQTVVGVPANVDHAMVELADSTGNGHGYTVESPGEGIAVNWSISPDGALLEAASSPTPVERGEYERLALSVTLVQPTGTTLTYRQEIDVRFDDDGVEVIWPPHETVCSLVTACGTSGTYVPDEDVHLDGVWIERSLTSDGNTSTSR